MDPSRWRNIGGADGARLREARLAAHYAAQWLARIARAYIPPRPHDFHTNLGWNGTLDGLMTHELPQGRIAVLKIPELTLVVRDVASGGEEHVLNLDGRRDADIRDWLGHLLDEMGLDAVALDAPSPYQMPAHPIGQGAPYAAAALAQPLAELAAWFGDADLVLAQARERAGARGLDVPPVRCWPHHFDLDSLIALGGGRTVGAGFCPGDNYYDEPYFYVSRYPAPDVSRLPSLPLSGHWHTRDFTAALALARDIAAAADQQTACEAFLNAAIDCLTGLG
jgi:hypothetical protein